MLVLLGFGGLGRGGGGNVLGLGLALFYDTTPFPKA